MDETPNDSGELPAKPPLADQLAEQIRRPAVWGLLLLIAVVLAVQVWLLYL